MTAAIAGYVTVYLMTFDKQSNARRISVESKSNCSCNHRLSAAPDAQLLPDSGAIAGNKTFLSSCHRSIGKLRRLFRRQCVRTTRTTSDETELDGDNRTADKDEHRAAACGLQFWCSNYLRADDGRFVDEKGGSADAPRR